MSHTILKIEDCSFSKDEKTGDIYCILSFDVPSFRWYDAYKNPSSEKRTMFYASKGKTEEEAFKNLNEAFTKNELLPKQSMPS